MTRNVAIIPARGGSRRIPGKNIKLFHDKPIIAYSIETALDSGLFDAVCVSTDNSEIEDIAEQYGAEVLHRPAWLAQDDVGTQRVMSEELSYLLGLCEYGFACCIYATAPMMKPSDLCLGYYMLRRDEAPMTYAVGSDGIDAGQWYWGTVSAFLRCADPHAEGFPIYIPRSRVCDINTPEDWERAERMYERRKQC